MKARKAVVLLLWCAIMPAAIAQVPYGRLLKAAEDPRNWLTYSGTYDGRRHSQLRHIDPTNVRNLELKWVFQARSLEPFEATPLVVDGIMYVTQPTNDVVALDARLGRVFWIYRYPISPDARACCGAVNRGLAISGDTLFLATLDAHLVAIDARSGRPLWKTKVAEARDGYAMTLAPLVVKDKVVVGVAGGEFGIRGFVAAYSVATGKEAWKFYTIPGPGEPGHETWAGDSWKYGGSPIWTTGTFDPVLNLTYWGTGNPGPDWNNDQRAGDNLYSDSVVALDPDTGRLKWHFQFTPNDPYDYDATQVPVLVDAEWQGRPRNLMYFANRNGFFYVLDRATGQFLLGEPYITLNWAKGLDSKGRPVPAQNPPGAMIYPGPQGGTNWYSPSFSPRTGLFYVSIWEGQGDMFKKEFQEYKAGQRFMGGTFDTGLPGVGGTPGGIRRGPVNEWSDSRTGHGSVIAIEPRTGKTKWRFDMHDFTNSGILTTASDLLFTGGREGYFYALDARNGKELWRVTTGGQVWSAPITYEVDSRQYVAVAAGHSLFVFGLRQ